MAYKRNIIYVQNLLKKCVSSRIIQRMERLVAGLLANGQLIVNVGGIDVQRVFQVDGQLALHIWTGTPEPVG